MCTPHTHSHTYKHTHSQLEHTHSGKPTVKKCKRRQDQNVVINELASLVPLSTPLVSCDSSLGSLVPSSGNKPPITSVLRLTTSYFRLQNFLKSSTSKYRVIAFNFLFILGT